MKLKHIFIVLLLLVSIPVMALSQELDFKDPNSIVIWLMPVLTLSATWVLKRIPIISGTLTLILVPVVSLGITYLTSIITGDASWLVQTLAGVGAVFLHQLYEHLTGNK